LQLAGTDKKFGVGLETFAGNKSNRVATSGEHQLFKFTRIFWLLAMR